MSHQDAVNQIVKDSNNATINTTKEFLKDSKAWALEIAKAKGKSALALMIIDYLCPKMVCALWVVIALRKYKTHEMNTKYLIRESGRTHVKGYTTFKVTVKNKKSTEHLVHINTKFL